MQLAFTTSSTKKRRLVRSENDGPDEPFALASPLKPGGEPRFPPPNLSAERSGGRSKSSSPVRYLPSHLQSTAFDGLGRSSSSALSEDTIRTGASSPFAGLSLDTERDGEMPGAAELDRDGDLTLPSPKALAPSPTYCALPAPLNDPDVLMTVPERASSPALKRPASDLEEGTEEAKVPLEGGSPLKVVLVPSSDGVTQEASGASQAMDRVSLENAGTPSHDPTINGHGSTDSLLKLSHDMPAQTGMSSGLASTLSRHAPFQVLLS